MTRALSSVGMDPDVTVHGSVYKQTGMMWRVSRVLLFALVCLLPFVSGSGTRVLLMSGTTLPRSGEFGEYMKAQIELSEPCKKLNLLVRAWTESIAYQNAKTKVRAIGAFVDEGGLEGEAECLINPLSLTFPSDRAPCPSSDKRLFFPRSSTGYLVPNFPLLARALHRPGSVELAVLFLHQKMDPSAYELFKRKHGCLRVALMAKGGVEVTPRLKARLGQQMLNSMLAQAFVLGKLKHPVSSVKFTSPQHVDDLIRAQGASLSPQALFEAVRNARDDPASSLSSLYGFTSPPSFPKQGNLALTFSNNNMDVGGSMGSELFPDFQETRSAFGAFVWELHEASLVDAAPILSDVLSSPQKSQEVKRTLIFVMGIEGTGHHFFHHIFGSMGPPLQKSVDLSQLLQRLLSSPTDALFESRRQQLLEKVSKLKGTYLLNTFQEMMQISYPYGDMWVAEKWCIAFPRVCSFLFFFLHALWILGN